jgi:RNA polymerase sigma-70 factor (ECF subfamily)
MIAAEDDLKALMVRSQDGDAAAYRALLNAVREALAIYFGRRLSDAMAAEDLTQETLMAIHAKRATYDPAQPFTAWAYALARYKLIDHYRRSRIRRTEPLEGAEALFSIDAGFDAAAARMDLDTLMRELPEKQADAIRMTKVEGLSTAEAAARAGASESAIKVSVHRGLKALSAAVKGEKGGGRE